MRKKMKHIYFGLSLGLGLGLIYILATNPVALIIAGILTAFLLGGVWAIVPVILISRYWSQALRPGHASHHYRFPAPPTVAQPPASPPDEFSLLPAATYPSFDDDQPVA
jgi:hypothetical protein